jgi:hypothetical protein
MCEDGWREAMVGTIGFDDRDGRRQHTIDLGATPGYGAAPSLHRMATAILRVKAK